MRSCFFRLPSTLAPLYFFLLRTPTLGVAPEVPLLDVFSVSCHFFVLFSNIDYKFLYLYFCKLLTLVFVVFSSVSSFLCPLFRISTVITFYFYFYKLLMLVIASQTQLCFFLHRVISLSYFPVSTINSVTSTLQTSDKRVYSLLRSPSLLFL